MHVKNSMTFTSVSALPDVLNVLDQYPIQSGTKAKIVQHRKEIEAILSGEDDRLLLIIGPCSAFSREAVLEYAHKLKHATEPLKDRIKVVLRVYTQKPRTTFGWKGALLHPDPYGEPDLTAGIEYCRKMMVQIAEEVDLPMADEILYTDLCLPYLSDLYSYGCIGARSSELQRKRMVASGIDFPMGMKNPTSGNLVKAVQSVVVAQAENGPFPHLGAVVTTQGNHYAHLILRGGNGKPNYQADVLEDMTDALGKEKIQNSAIIVDVSHENSINGNGEKDVRNQIMVANCVLDYKKTHSESAVKGIMMESFLNEGHQYITDRDDFVPGTSLTDECLGWRETERFLKEITNYL